MVDALLCSRLPGLINVRDDPTAPFCARFQTNLSCESAYTVNSEGLHSLCKMTSVNGKVKCKPDSATFACGGPPKLPGKSAFLALQHLEFAPARILDVGANEGHWTRGILRVFPSASVVMVEANEARRQDWRGLPASVRGLISVLSDKEGEVPWFTTPGAATGDSMFQERTSWVETSNTTRHALTLDGLLAREGLADGPFGLVKLDVQGAELTVLRGAARALSQAEVLFMELPLVSARKRTRACNMSMHMRTWAPARARVA